MVKYIGARSAANEYRWLALLDAALNQPHPIPELLDALRSLEKRPSGRLALKLMEQEHATSPF